MKGFAALVILALCIFVFMVYAITQQVSGF